jgi:hypothetical protein
MWSRATWHWYREAPFGKKSSVARLASCQRKIIEIEDDPVPCPVDRMADLCKLIGRTKGG